MLVNKHYKLQQNVFIFLQKMQLVPWASWSFVPGHPPGAVISPTMAFFCQCKGCGNGHKWLCSSSLTVIDIAAFKNTRIYIIQSFLGNESRNI